MTNTFNKVLSVFLSVASVVFLGFVIAYVSGGVNWQSEMRAEDLTEYDFQLSTGENPKWTVKGVNDKVVATVDEEKLADAVVKTRKDLESRQRAELTKLNDVVAQVEPQLKAVQDLEKLDLEAIKKREVEVEAYLDGIHKKVLEVSDALAKRVQDTTDTRTLAADRRRDVYRLTNELEALRTDRARLVELRRELADELLRLQITNHSLKQRASQLRNSD